jgi:hypothetical protein
MVKRKPPAKVQKKAGWQQKSWLKLSRGEASSVLRTVVQKCTAINPRKRPTFTQIIALLRLHEFEL